MLNIVHHRFGGSWNSSFCQILRIPIRVGVNSLTSVKANYFKVLKPYVVWKAYTLSYLTVPKTCMLKIFRIVLECQNIFFQTNRKSRFLTKGRVIKGQNTPSASEHFDGNICFFQNIGIKRLEKVGGIHGWGVHGGLSQPMD